MVNNTDTSAAAKPGESEVRNLQRRVLMVLAESAMTADQAADRLYRSPLAIRPRFTELKIAGKIRDTGKRRRNHSGRSAAVYEIVRAQTQAEDNDG